MAPLDPKIQLRLELGKNAPELTDLPPVQSRKLFDEWAALEKRLEETVAKIEQRTIAGPHGELPLRVYWPHREPKETSIRRPIVVYFHGGGWVFGSLNSHHDFCQSICHRSGAVVVAVDYRLSPESKFPVAVDECYAAVVWAAAHAGELGADPQRLAVAGDSAGGNLAAVMALRARDEQGPHIAQQLLIYPATNQGFDTASYHQFASGYGLSRRGMQIFWEHYLSCAANGAHPYASPLQAPDLRGLPPAFVVLAHYDVLRDDGLAYAARLEQAGVDVCVSNYLSMTHGFARLPGEFTQASQVVDEIAAEIQRTARAGS